MIEERRSGTDRRRRPRRTRTRRAGQRRTASRPVEHDRRGAIRRRGKKRRGDGDRRQSPDRRAGASPFDPAKAEQIREVMARTGVPTVCPHCNQQLQLGPPIRAGGLQYREVHCLACRRSARIANLP